MNHAASYHIAINLLERDMQNRETIFSGISFCLHAAMEIAHADDVTTSPELANFNHIVERLDAMEDVLVCDTSDTPVCDELVSPQDDMPVAAVRARLAHCARAYEHMQTQRWGWNAGVWREVEHALRN